MRYPFITAPGLLAAMLVWHEVVDCKPYKIMSGPTTPLGYLALLLGAAASLAVAFADVRKPHFLWPIISAIVGLGVAYTTVALPTLYWRAAEASERLHHDFSWHSCFASLNEQSLNAAAISGTAALLVSAVLGVARFRANRF
jgi:hypothetical protein